jgi:glucose-1-phosphate cytidylyltransferase
VSIDDSRVTSFAEKPAGDGAWVNGGYFVLEPAAFEYLEGDQTSWESNALAALSRDGKLAGYQHSGFWQAMDTLRDKNHLEDLWHTGNAPWKVWT